MVAEGEWEILEFKIPSGVPSFCPCTWMYCLGRDRERGKDWSVLPSLLADSDIILGAVCFSLFELMGYLCTESMCVIAAVKVLGKKL